MREVNEDFQASPNSTTYAQQLKGEIHLITAKYAMYFVSHVNRKRCKFRDNTVLGTINTIKYPVWLNCVGPYTGCFSAKQISQADHLNIIVKSGSTTPRFSSFEIHCNREQYLP